MNYVLTLFIFSFFSPSNVDNEARVKAMFMFHFIRNMEWPTEKQDDKYTVAVIGNIDILDQISEITKGKQINNKEVEVVNYTSAIEMKDINMLFISNALSGQFEQFQKQAVPNSVVIVTESPGMAKKGAAINFIANGDKLAFELNKSTLDRSKVNTSRTIINSAKLVD